MGIGNKNLFPLWTPQHILIKSIKCTYLLKQNILVFLLYIWKFPCLGIEIRVRCNGIEFTTYMFKIFRCLHSFLYCKLYLIDWIEIIGFFSIDWFIKIWRSLKWVLLVFCEFKFGVYFCSSKRKMLQELQPPAQCECGREGFFKKNRVK